MSPLADGTTRSGWYVGGGIGSNWVSDLGQEGWNRDPLCYPTDACFNANPVPEISGYRRRYDIGAAAGAVFEVSASLIFDHLRLELSLAQRKNGLDQMFRASPIKRGCPWRNGAPVRSYPRPGPRSTISLSAPLRSMPTTIFRVCTAGLLPTWKLGWVPHSSRCPGCTSPPIPGHVGQYSSLRSSPVVLQQPSGRGPPRYGLGRTPAWGADYGLNNKTLLGLKLTYSMMGDIESNGRYSLHPFHERDPDLTNHNTFTGP